MMMKSATATVLLALSGIAAAASNTAEVSLINNEVIGEPSAAEIRNEDRSLLHSDNGCITLRISSDDNAEENSVLLEDLDEDDKLLELKEGDIESGLEDHGCIYPEMGHKLKLTMNSPEGYSSSAFHAMFVGPLRAIRIQGDAKNEVDVICFKVESSSPYYHQLDCEDTANAAEDENEDEDEEEEEEEESNSAPSGPPPPSPPANIPPFSSRMGCGSGEKMIKVEFEKDQWNENMWYIKKKDSNEKVLECDSEDDYCLSEEVEICLEEDDYELVMEDGLGDGCPKFVLSMENSDGDYTELTTKCYNGKKWTRHFHTKTVQMTERELSWLNEHNDRRRRHWYDVDKEEMKEGNNPHYVPQRWDPELAAQAQTYANTLLNGCSSNSMAHDPNRNGAGENMAKNRGTPGSQYGSQYHPSGILNRFVEMELDKPFGERYHMSQVLWLASAYIGCADGFKTYQENGVTKHCHTQVCRYSAPGNCGVNANNDLERMMLGPDQQNCGMKLPPSGLYV